MAARQKSFFDQDHSGTKVKWPWAPSRRFAPPEQRRNPTPQAPKPPIKASTQSRTKLQAFRFHQSQEMSTGDARIADHGVGKENTRGVGKSHQSEDDLREQGSHRRLALSQLSQEVQTPRPGTKKPVPQTPGVSLDDLFDDGNDRDITTPQSTPKDQVDWEHGRLRSSQLTPITPSMRRSNKRPRSESPPLSSKASNGQKGIGNGVEKSVHGLTAKTPMRTPRLDTGADLWSIYARHELATPSRPPATTAANFTHSSPQDPVTSASRCYKRCRSDLTHTVRKKRRRLEYSHSERMSQLTSSNLPPAADSKSRIPYLLQKLKEATDIPSEDEFFRQGQVINTSSSSTVSAQDPNENGFPIKSQRLSQAVVTNDGGARSIPDGQEKLSHLYDTGLDPSITANAENNGTGDLPPLEAKLCSVSSSGAREFVRSPPKSHMISPRSAQHQTQIRGNEQGFSDSSMEDELLSTCLAVERKSTATDAQRSLTNQNSEIGKCVSSVSEQAGEMFEEQDQDSHAQVIQVSESGPVTKSFGDFDDDFEDDWDADDIANLELVASTLHQSAGAPLSEHRQQDHLNAVAEEHINDMIISRHCDEKEAWVTSDDQGASGAYGAQGNPVDLVEDEFAEEGIDDLFAELVTEHEKSVELPDNSKNQQAPHSRTIQRYLVKAVHDNQYMTSRGFQGQERVLLVEEEATKGSRAITLRDEWADSPCSQGSYVHVLAQFDKAGQCTIDHASGILVIHPDHLISATVVSDSFGCIRRAVLQDRVKATNEASQPQVYGHILHEIFQEALQANRWEASWLSQLIRKVSQRYLESLFEINVDLDQAVSQLEGKISLLQDWANAFVTSKPGKKSVINDRNGLKALMSVTKLLDVEEHIWSPRYGLKGNVDATVQVMMQDGQDERILTVPLELKTGKNSSNASHKAQTALYTLLLSDRYDIHVDYGILYYLETSEMSRIPSIRHELIHMIKQRNEVAAFARNRLDLPPMLKNERLCGRCYAQTSCFIYHKLMEDGNGETSGLKDKFDQEIQHLLPQHQEFFRKWDRLLTKEEGDLIKFRRELWTMTSAERQKLGRCFAKVVVESGSASETVDGQKINRFKYTFVKHESSPLSFTESQITTGEPIVVSDEQGHYALANGYVASLRKNSVTVAVDRRLHNARIKGPNFDDSKNQDFSGIMEVSTASRTTVENEVNSTVEPIIYRLDKDEFSNGMATVRNNLLRIMEKDLFGAQALRRLVIDRVAPVFFKETAALTVSDVPSQLNVDQRAAIKKVTTAKDYALVLGMPGTGKTTTIAHIIRTLVSQGKSVLLTSYTHTAVDNILLKIQNDKIKTLRIGAIAKVHPEVAAFADLAAIPKTNIDDLKRSYASQVVATTCLGINHPIFNQRIFDYCIVDEASQITLPVCLGPIRMARTFILVGDHFQLPPLVQNKEALDGGLDVSLFKYLSDAHPSSVVTLKHQYRMNEDIMSLSNELIYNGQLKCGSDAVASRRIKLQNLSALSIHHHTTSTLSGTQTSLCSGPKSGICWLYDALIQSSPVVFLNTDPLGEIAQEQKTGSRIINQLEVTFTAQLVTALLSVGVNAHDIGVITLYRSQLAELRHELRAQSSAASAGSSTSFAADVEMHTADKYQGRDKEAIVLSLVRNNEAKNVGDLLKDWRRVNVALTRARTKLIILGSWKTMSGGSDLLKRLCDLIEQRGWRRDLKKGAVGDHYFEALSSQASMPTKRDTQESTPSKTKAEPAVAQKSPIGSKVTRLKALLQKTNNPPYKLSTVRQPAKRVLADPKVVLKKRPVLSDIVNESSPHTIEYESSENHILTADQSWETLGDF